MSKCWDATRIPATTRDQRHFVVRQQRCVRRFPTLRFHRGQCLSCGFLLTVWARPEVAIGYRAEVAIAPITGAMSAALWTKFEVNTLLRSISKASKRLPTPTSVEIMWVELQICYQDVPVEHLGSDTGHPKWVPWFHPVPPAYSDLHVDHDLQIPFVRLSPGQAPGLRVVNRSVPASRRVRLGQRFSNCGPRTTSGPRALPLWSF